MSCVKKILFALMASILAGSCSLASAESPTTPADMSPGPGRDLIVDRCVTCHAVSIIGSVPHAPDQWEEVIDIMVQRGAKVSDNELDTIAAYLAKNYSQPQASSPAAAPKK